jgi:hypothetical protein
MRFDPHHLSRRLRRRRADAADRQLRQRGWYDLSARSDAEAVFVGGCGRSGTTLVKEILNRHPAIACGPETSMFGLPFNPDNIGPIWGLSTEDLRDEARRSSNLVEFAQRFYSRFAEAENKRRWADKTPNNIRSISQILTWFPRGMFIHIVRDGRDVACSLRHHPSERVVGGRVVPVKSNNPISRCAQRWLADTSRGLAFDAHPRVMRINYEDLVQQPESTTRKLCEFIGEPFDARMLEAPAQRALSRPGEVLNNSNAKGRIDSSSIGRWRRDLDPDERRQFHDIAGELLIAAGYATDDGWIHEH